MLLFVPLDDRPCCRDFPARLAEILDIRLERPPDAMLGCYTAAGDPERLDAWLAERLEAAEGGILSLDMLLFGGLVASRALDRDESSTHRALERLRERLRVHGRGVDLFSVLMRVPPFCTSQRDRRLSDHLMALSAAQARAGTQPGALARMRLAALRKRIAPDFLARYEQTRARNHAVNTAALAWARAGEVDFTLIGMDDSKTAGFNVAERALLEPQLVPGRSDLLPGADEVAMLLLARHALRRHGCPLRLAVRFSPEGFAKRETRYEDRSVGALIEAHARVLGLTLVSVSGLENDPVEADVHLFVNGCAGRQQEAATQIFPPHPSARHRALARAVASSVESGVVTAVADLGYANGGDRAFLAALGDAVALPRLDAFAAWNTAGNTVGTALAQAVLRALQRTRHDLDARATEAAHQRFLLERFLDDTLYQSQVRSELGRALALERVNVYALGERHADVEARAAARMKEAASAFFDRHFRGQVSRGLRIVGPLRLRARLPWPRIFEIDLEAGFDLVDA